MHKVKRFRFYLDCYGRGMRSFSFSEFSRESIYNLEVGVNYKIWLKLIGEKDILVNKKPIRYKLYEDDDEDFIHAKILYNKISSMISDKKFDNYYYFILEIIVAEYID